MTRIEEEEERFHERMSDEEAEEVTRWWQEEIAKEEIEMQKGLEELAKEEKRREKRVQMILLDWSKNHPLWTEVLGECVELCREAWDNIRRTEDEDWIHELTEHAPPMTTAAENMAVNCIAFENKPTLAMASNFSGFPMVSEVREQILPPIRNIKPVLPPF